MEQGHSQLTLEFLELQRESEGTGEVLVACDKAKSLSSRAPGHRPAEGHQDDRVAESGLRPII